MTDPLTREQCDLIRVWRERFGEPPAILAEPELIRAVLEACGGPASPREED
ncbi:MAG TPA: hypothetical protein VEA79_00645 [Phenylobacterium sp.]|nr:hypothetical protein [Phenylobacterium sp.]